MLANCGKAQGRSLFVYQPDTCLRLVNISLGYATFRDGLDGADMISTIWCFKHADSARHSFEHYLHVLILPMEIYV